MTEGAYHTCATRTDGTLWCWGDNNIGEAGIGSYTLTKSPTQVGKEKKWATVSAGYDSTCATKTDGINLRAGRVAIDTRAREAHFDGRLLNLSRQEYLLLLTLTERAGRVVARDFLDRVLFGTEGTDSNALEVHVHSLRRKTEPGLIRTARGLGYLLEDEPR